MSPTLRSSTPSTPTVKRVAGDTTPKSARKVPHCQRCHRPRAGHPRQGCPYTETSNGDRAVESLDLSQALGSMRLETPHVEHTEVRRTSKLHGASLVSLSTDSSEILRSLAQPGMMGDDSDEEEAMNSKILKKAGDLKTPTRARRKLEKGRIMPGTLDTPGSSFVHTEPSQSQATQASPPPLVAIDSPSTVSQIGSTRRLARSMSIEERAAFLNGLAEISRSPPATVYTVPLPELPSIQRSATRLGFHTRVVTPEKGSKETNGLLVIGTDVHAVEKLFDKLTREVQGGSGLRSAAGGAVVGAVATFTGLAFA
ncbi:hypothetical protein BV25DRAFT_1866549 [Artomyces pyxidatus]|uniref:Uncharacterized protein n=1 Tax=Artomyces pyxidatus TaxID=48021 RepID=A0ACB8TJJ5_9AGAM|nr:hypothetical protein BV25DRAFT_1866549 [Artomyces pyxidatus]